MRADWDVVVIGGGPAGATTAALIAERGLSVLVLEKARFPRFHIGESLLPACLPVLDRLGVEPQPDTYVYKGGATFLCEEVGAERSFPFDLALPGCPRHAWHVERSLFDAQLLERARAAGAEVCEGVEAEDTGVDADGVRVRSGGALHRARFLVDASGQGRFLARRRGSTRPNARFGRSAVQTHFADTDERARAELGPDWNIRILLRPEGWGWVIPLPEGRLSIGVVGRGALDRATFEEGCLASPLVRRLTAGAARLETRTISSFSYENRRPFAPRTACVGDASCFLDPVFSSGVTLALRGAAGLSDALLGALQDGAEANPGRLDQHAAGMRRAERTFSALIERFYHSNFARTMFLGDSLGFELRAGVMSVLAGDVWRFDNPFQDLLLRARRPVAGSANDHTGC